MSEPKTVYYCRELEGVKCPGCSGCENSCRDEAPRLSAQDIRKRCEREVGHPAPHRWGGGSTARKLTEW